MLKGATGNNRSMAIAEIAPYLKIGLTGQETADILGTASELSEAARANAIQSIARAGKTMPGLSEGELAPVLVGMTGSNRALALSELRVSASPSAASVGGIAALPPSPQTPPPIQTPRSAEATSPSPPQSPSAGAPIPSSSSASATSPPQSATAGTTPSVINPVPGELPKLPIDQLRLAEYAYQFGLLSQSVYNVDPVSSVTVPTRGGTESWERVGVPLIRASGNLSQDWGFRAGVYLNKKGTADQRRWRCAVVFAGSEKGIDWLANINQFLVGPMPEQYRMSTEFARSALDGPCKGIQTILAGHSLGGGLAQYVYAQTGEKHITFTFNPAGLGYGRLEFRGVNWRAGKVISFVAHSFDPSSGKVIGRDVVSMTGVTLGREILVPVYSRWPYPHLIEVLVEGLGLQRDYCLHDARCR